LSRIIIQGEEMKMKILNIAAVISTVILLSVCTLIISKHLKGLAKLTVQNNILKQLAVIAPEDKNDTSGRNMRPDSQVYGYTKPDWNFAELLFSEKYEKPADKYTLRPPAASSPEISNKKVRDEGEDKHEYSRQPYAEVPGKTVITKVHREQIEKFTSEESKSGSVGYSSKTNVFQDDETENDDTGWNGEPVQEHEEQEPDRDENENRNYNVSVSREVQSVALDKAVVILSIHINDVSPSGLIVNEHVPAGWEILESTPPYRSFNPSTGEIKWLFIGSGVTDMKINYRV
jgi:hypothetical protein